MEIKQLLTVLPILPASISVLLRGPHGIGKSALPRHVGRVLGLPVVDRRLSQMSEGDLVGLPELVNGVTRFAPPDWYKKACMEPTIVFLDELNRATPEVMQAAFQIVLDRELNGHRLHAESRVYSAINSSAEYQVNDMDPALLDRFWVADVDATVQDWLAWAKEEGSIGSDIVDFIQTHEQHLRHSGQMEPGKIYPSQRSWERLDIALKHAELAADPANPLFLHVSQGLLGIETSLAFQDFVKNYQSVITAEDILDNWKKVAAKVKDLPTEKKLSIIEKVKDHCKRNKWNLNQVANLKSFFETLTGECKMSLYNGVLASGNTGNLTSFHGLVKDEIMGVINAAQAVAKKGK